MHPLSTLSGEPLYFKDLAHARGEKSQFACGERVLVASREPIGHYRVPFYLRGKEAVVEAVIAPAALDNEQEGFGRNAGGKSHYYRLSVLMSSLWPGYSGSPTDALRIEVFETWLERI